MFRLKLGLQYQEGSLKYKMYNKLCRSMVKMIVYSGYQNGTPLKCNEHINGDNKQTRGFETSVLLYRITWLHKFPF